jgi:hypothetical protein
VLPAVSYLHMRNSDQKSIMVNNFLLRTAAKQIEAKRSNGGGLPRLCRSTSFGHPISVMFKAFRSGGSDASSFRSGTTWLHSLLLVQ